MAHLASGGRMRGGCYQVTSAADCWHSRCLLKLDSHRHGWSRVSENKERPLQSRRGGCAPRRRLVASDRLLVASSIADSRRQGTNLVPIGAMNAECKIVVTLAAFSSYGWTLMWRQLAVWEPGPLSRRATSAAVSEAAAAAVVGGTLYFRYGLASAQRIT